MQTRFLSWFLTFFCDSGFNGQFQANFRCPWLLRFPVGFNSLSFLSSGAFIVLLRRLSILTERDLGDITSHGVSVVVLPYRFGRASLTCVCKEHSMCGHVCLPFRSVSRLGFQSVLCAISCFASQRALFSFVIGIHPVRPLCSRLYNDGPMFTTAAQFVVVLPGRSSARL